MIRDPATGRGGARAFAAFAFLLCAAVAAWAQGQKSAEDYFHAGAERYIAGRHQEAAVEIEEGLRHWPGDPRLQTLAGHLEDMKRQQRRGNDGQEDQGDGEEPREGDDSRDSEGDPGDDDGNPDGRNDEERPPRPDPDPEQREGDDGEPRRPPPGEMSEEEARRLLDSFADDEKEEQRGRRVPLGERPDMEQTW